MARKYLIETYGCQMNVHDSERMAGLLEQAGYESTGDAHDADDSTGALRLPLAQEAEIAVEPVLGLLADRAGIDEEQIRGVRVAALAPAGVQQEVAELLRVVDVHLAAVRPDVERTSRLFLNVNFSFYQHGFVHLSDFVAKLANLV